MFIAKIEGKQLKDLNTTRVFNSQEWINISCDEGFQLRGIFNKNKELIGSFYYYNFKRGKLLTQVSAPPFSPDCGLYIDDKTINPAQKNTFRKKVLALIQDYLDNQKFDILSLPFPAEFVDMQQFIWKGYSVEPRYTYQLDLNESEEGLLSKMSSERRKNIRKASKDGISSRRVANFKEAKELIYGTYIKQNLDAKIGVLERLFTSFATEENSMCYVSYDEHNNTLSTVFCVFDKDFCYYILGGYNENKKHEGAGALAMWEAIKYAKNKELSIFDFEGSMLPAVEKYFRGFGGEITPNFTVNKNNWKGSLFLKLRALISRKKRN